MEKKLKTKPSSLKKILIFSFAFLIVMFLSEVIFQLRNDGDLIFRMHLNLARLSSQTSSVSSSFYFLGKAAKIRLNRLAKEYSEINLQKEVNTPPLPDNEQLIEDYKVFLKNLDYKKLTRSHESLGVTFYNLGLIAFRHNEPELVVPFWKTSASITPELSYFHIELANYYLIRGGKEKAIVQLDYCLQFRYPKSFCQWYINNYLKNDS